MRLCTSLAGSGDTGNSVAGSALAITAAALFAMCETSQEWVGAGVSFGCLEWHGGEPGAWLAFECWIASKQRSAEHLDKQYVFAMSANDKSTAVRKEI